MATIFPATSSTRLMRALLLLVLALALPVQAQQVEPRVELAIEGLDPGPMEMGEGAHQLPFTVTARVSGLACTAQAVLPVRLTVTDKPSPLLGLKADVMDAALNFTIPAGEHVQQPMESSMDSMLHTQVTSEAPPAHDHEFEVTATFSGGMPDGCIATGELPEATASASHALRTPAAPASASNPAARSADPEPSVPASKSTPAPWTAFVLLTLAAAATLRRR